MLAAALAVLGLFARPLQALVDCPMPMNETVAAEATAVGENAEQPVEQHAEHRSEQHAEAHVPGAPAAEANAEGESEEPDSQRTPGGRCPDVAHCAVAAPITDTELAPVAERVHVAVASFVNERPASTTNSLEPPPPKQR